MKPERKLDLMKEAERKCLAFHYSRINQAYIITRYYGVGQQRCVAVKRTIEEVAEYIEEQP